jgi:hypothetical protein
MLFVPDESLKHILTFAKKAGANQSEVSYFVLLLE